MHRFFLGAVNKHYRELTLVAIDVVIAAFSLGLSVLLNFNFQYAAIRYIGLRIIGQSVVVVLAVYIASLLLFRVQKSLWSYIGVREMLQLAMSVIASTVTLMLLAIILRMDARYVSISIVMGLISLALMSNVRVVYIIFALRPTRGEAMENSLIIGAGDGGYLMLKELEKNTKHKAKIIGFVDDNRKDKIIAGKKVLGTTENIPAIVKNYRIKKLFIAIPSVPKSDLNRILNICQQCNIETKIMQHNEFMEINPESGINAYPIKPVSISDLLGRGEINLNIDQISSYLTGKTVLVTGAGGSIGSALCKQIVRFRPSKLVLFDIGENNMYDLEQEFERARLHGIISQDLEIVSEVGSVREKEQLEQILSNHMPSAVFHAAAHKHVPLMEHCPKEAIKNNVFGTKNIIEASILCGAERFILISTDKAVKPANVMGASKRLGELVMQRYAQVSQTQMAAVRFGNVLGSSGSVIPLFEKQISEGGPITLTHKDVERFFMTIPEAAQLVMQAGSFASKGEIFVLDMGEPIKIIDLAEKMIRLSGYKPYEDIDIVEIGLRPGEKMAEELSLTEEELMPTPNPSISVAHPVYLPFRALDDALDELSEVILDGASNETAREVLIRVSNMKFSSVESVKPAGRA